MRRLQWNRRITLDADCDAADEGKTMASLAEINGKRGSTWRLDFFLSDDPKRKCIRLGKMSKRQAVSIKTNVERLIEAKATGTRTQTFGHNFVASLAKQD